MESRYKLQLVALTVAGIFLAGCSSAASPDSDANSPQTSESAAASASPTPPLELPQGGREIFPDYRLVGYSGAGGDPSFSLGRLSGDLDARCQEIKTLGKKYARGRTVQPVFENISTTVTASPGDDGKYRFRRDNAEIREYLKAARKCEALLLLNIQPGQSEFMPEMKHFEEFLREPDVGVALDPEWAMDPGKVPGIALGRTTGKELNDAAIYLSEIVDEYNLPEKVMVYHQFNDTVDNPKQLKPQEGVAIVRSIDGLGGPASKTETYDRLVEGQPKFIHPGFKLFYSEDVNPPWGSRLMTPNEVMSLKPRPEYVLYE
jgi:hypothetical protein